MRRYLSLIIIALFICNPVSTAPLMPEGVRNERLVTEVLWQSIKDLKVGERPRVVLVLGGGGARGLAHIGVLRVFEEAQIPIDKIVGISVGALLGALYAGGVSVSQLETMASEVGWNKLTDLSRMGLFKMLLTDELLSTERMEIYLEERLGRKFFSDLNIPFTCTATDIQTGERIVFKDGPVAIAARASATIPGIFRPVEYEQRFLVDGGLTDTLPTDLARDESWSVVVGVLPSSNLEEYDVTSILASLVRSIEIQRDVMVEERKKLADFIIEPHTQDISLVDIDKGDEAIQAGTRDSRLAVLELKKLIIKMVLEKQK